MNVYIIEELNEKTRRQLDRMERMLQAILQKETTMNEDLDSILAEVTAEAGVIASNTTLLTALSAYIIAHANDPVKMNAIGQAIKNGTDEINAAILANPVPGQVVPPTP